MGENEYRPWEALGVSELDYWKARYLEITALLPDEAMAVVEAALVLKRGFEQEDQTPESWKSDPVLDHRIHDLFVSVEAYEKAKGGSE